MVIAWSRLVEMKFCLVLLGSQQCYKLFINFILRLSRQGGIPLLYCWDAALPWSTGKYISIDWRYFYCILQRIWHQSIRKKLTNVFIKFHHFMNLWVFVHWHAFNEKLKENLFKSKQIPGWKLSRPTGTKFNFSM